MGLIEDRLDASLRFGAHNGDASERAVFARQAQEAVLELRQLRAAALRTTPAEGREPVAWGTRNLKSGVVTGALLLKDDLIVFHDEEAIPLYAHPAPDARDAVDATRYRFLRDNPFQLRAIDGNAVWRGNVSAEDFDAHTDVAMANPAFAPTPSEERPDAE